MIKYDYSYETTEKVTKDSVVRGSDQPLMENIKYSSTRLLTQLHACENCSSLKQKEIEQAVTAIEREIASKNTSSRVLAHMLTRTHYMIDSIKKTPEVLLAYGRWQSLIKKSIKCTLK